jgi:arginine-tRNA-protein transferase
MPQDLGIVQHFQARGTCPYLMDHRESITDYLIFGQEVDPFLYGALIRDGWRRYGKGLYRMLCPGCRLCIPLRIHAASMHLAGSLRRILLLNRDLLIIPRPPAFIEEHYMLWRNYSLWKHSCNPDELDEASYCQLFVPWSLIFEYRENNENKRLIALSHVDPLAGGLSSVYFSFAPEAKARSPGFFSILAEAYIAAFIKPDKLPLNKEISAKTIFSFYENKKTLKSTRPGADEDIGCQHGSPWYYYLGFWIPGAPKMDYKARIRPFELAIAESEANIASTWRQYASRDEALAYLHEKRWPGL